MSSMASIYGQLDISLRKTAAQWQETKSVWRDHKAQEFDQRYWASLDEAGMRTLREMEQVSQTMERVKQRYGFP